MTTSLKHAACILAFSMMAFAAPRMVSAADDAPKPPDNTKVNERDRNGNELTADNQKQNKGDVDITAQIRRAVVKDDSLSTNAHNVKIITVNGMVTLKGPVKNDTEKMTIEKVAKDVAGEKNVTNQIDVTP